MKGLLFKEDMHKAIREGRKTVTRRLSGLAEINQEPNKWVAVKAIRIIPPVKIGDWIFQHTDGHCVAVRPRYQVGEIVYVKEVYWVDYLFKYNPSPETRYIHYKLGHDESIASKIVSDDLTEKKLWKTPLFMPADFARTFLKITDVRPERLQDITNDDVILEGIKPPEHAFKMISGGGVEVYSPIDDYVELWDTINPKYPFSNNPYVWRIEFILTEREAINK